MDHLERIKREGARHPHDLLSRFYNNTADAARHRQPTVVSRGPGLPSLPRFGRAPAVGRGTARTSARPRYKPTNRAPRRAGGRGEGGAPDWFYAGASPPGSPYDPPVTAEAEAPPTFGLFEGSRDDTITTAA